MTKKEFITLLTDYGNANYDCGEWDGDITSEYNSLSDIASDLKQQVIDCLLGKEKK